MTDGELKPCAHCGGPAEYIGGEHAGYRVECRHCGAQSGWGDYGFQVEAKWNTRAPDPALATKDATIARMAEALEGVVAAHDDYLASLSPEVRAYVDDPLAEACAIARAALDAKP